MKLPIVKPFFTEREKELVVKPLETGWLVQGPYVKRFEEMTARFVGAAHAVATTSCSTAQLIASRCVGIQAGDEVLVPAFTWISTANAAEAFGARPVFVDIDLGTFNMDVAKTAEAVGPKTKALFPVNLFGLMADMPGMRRIGVSNGVRIVEDCACALGALIGDTHAGLFGDCGCFSFHPRKSITTGEGGMLVTNDDGIADMARSLRNHGAVELDSERGRNNNAFLLSEYQLLGYNYRMTDLQGAVGVAQSEKLEEICRLKKRLAAIFDERLKEFAFLRAPYVPEGYTHAYQAYVALFEPELAVKAVAGGDVDAIDRLHEKRNGVMSALEEQGVSTRQGTHAVHIQEYYRNKYSLAPEDFINAYAADRLTFALPFYPSMTDDEVEYLFVALRKAYERRG